MARDEPFVCDVCGIDLRGESGNKMFTAEFAEFGRSSVGGKFCSMEHAITWSASPPPLVPRKVQFDPAAKMPKLALALLGIVLLALVSIIVGLITIASFLINSFT